MKIKILGTKKQFIAWLEEFGDTWIGFLSCNKEQQRAFIDMFNKDIQGGAV